MKKAKMVVLVIILAISIISCIGSTKTKNEKIAAKTDIELLNTLTRFMDHDRVVIDRSGLKENFFPLLDLGPRDSVLQAKFGINTDGRWIMFIIRKISRTGETTGLFEVTFYTERHRLTKEGTLIFFEAKNGKTYGVIPDNDFNRIINIYDLARGDYLVNDQSGRVTYSLNLADSLRHSSNHTAGNLINAGKTIGIILEEHLESLEKANKAGKNYRNDAINTHKAFQEMDPKYQYKIFFCE